MSGGFSGVFEFLDELRRENTTTPDLRQLHLRLAYDTIEQSSYMVREGLLYFKNRLVLSKYSHLKQQIISEFHDTPTGGHAGFERTCNDLISPVSALCRGCAP